MLLIRESAIESPGPLAEIRQEMKVRQTSRHMLCPTALTVKRFGPPAMATCERVPEVILQHQVAVSPTSSDRDTARASLRKVTFQMSKTTLR